MIYLQRMIAMDIARERSAEAGARSRRHALLGRASAGRGARGATLTSTLARVAARVSQGSASLANRLDRGTADEVLASEACRTPA